MTRVIIISIDTAASAARLAIAAATGRRVGAVVATGSCGCRATGGRTSNGFRVF